MFHIVRERGGNVARHPDTRLVYSTDGGAVTKEKEGPGGFSVGSRSRPGSAAGGRPPQGIRLRLERRPSDRVVTSVSGLPGSAAELTALVRALKSACGAGGTVKDRVVELQGDHRDAVEAFLAARGLKSKRAGR
jgi:translation initiation factor 1